MNNTWSPKTVINAPARLVNNVEDLLNKDDNNNRITDPIITLI